MQKKVALVDCEVLDTHIENIMNKCYRAAVAAHQLYEHVLQQLQYEPARDTRRAWAAFGLETSIGVRLVAYETNGTQFQTI